MNPDQYEQQQNTFWAIQSSDWKMNSYNLTSSPPPKKKKKERKKRDKKAFP